MKDATWNTGFPISISTSWQQPGQGSSGLPASAPLAPSFSAFFHQWRMEKLPEWRRLHIQGVDDIAGKHLLPWFGTMPVNQISRTDVMQFRAHLAKLPGQRGRSLSASRINKIFVILAQAMGEAASRYGFQSPLTGIRKLKSLRPEVQPFTLEEVRRLCDEVRPDYRDYFVCRFFTGMRTGEINGLKWSRVDLKRNVILVRETFSAGETEENAKSEHSIRDIPMLPPVRDALLARHAARSKDNVYVFASVSGGPIDAKNFTNRIFYPLLDRLGIARRRPYQTRHTTATLLLAAGENPEWIARFLGHANTEMLFTVYSRYVPNLTRRDGAAMSALLTNNHIGALSQEND
ncbi:tyrosine-type recombinase/integrase [Lysobacter soli]|uniref:tyrosine-type recombinase/integrase n=1 Tax=Lysobacter soli TaxID=453783 RepID=UPI0024101210|nr:site-specific integrase [Lysobacter soli]MDG2519271.1 tyrosine-type recombinase/integrase [Lysobacter soli]